MRLSASLHHIGSDIVNSYLVDDGGLVTIIDAGLPGQWREVVAELEAMDRSLDDVRAMVLTHGDTDHIGFAERLHRDSGVPIYIHVADARRARGEIKKSMTGLGRMRLRPTVGFLLYSARRGGLRIPPLTDVVTFEDGVTLDVPGAPRVIGLPGHTPGSVAFHVPRVDAVFVGDALTTRSVLSGETGPRPAPFTLDPAQALTSLSRLDDVDATWVLPGHGAPWDGGVREAARRYRVNAGTPGAGADAAATSRGPGPG